MNALKHGFFSQIVTKYDKLDQKDFCEEIYNQFNPQTIYEAQLVEVLLSNLLCYRRISLVERELIEARLDPHITKDLFAEEFKKYETIIIKKGYQTKIHANIVDALEKFQRYKATTVNLIYKTQHELERLTKSRNGEADNTPCAHDITLTQS